MSKTLFYRNAITGTDEVLNALEYALGTGNSARFIRGMILPISCFIIYIGNNVYNCYFKDDCAKFKELFLYIGIGISAGFSFAWSNDYGISCWLCLLIMSFWISICRERRLRKSVFNLFLAIGCSIITLFFTVEIFTLGHWSKWFSDTFGTGGYQSWYYNSGKSYYLYDVDFSYIMLIQVGLAVFYMVRLFMAHGSIAACRRYGILAYSNMTCFCAVNVYQILSGGGLKEIALSVLFINIVIECGLLLVEAINRDRARQITIVVSVICGFAWIISTAKEEFIFKFMTDKDGIYIGELGGNLTSLGDDLKNAELFLDGEEFFSTYSSAQEVVNGTFHPSGTDYIIHVLGDEQRENYIDTFNKGNFKYAATIREEYTDWESWVKTANWFFYRELYQGWHPVYANTYELYWARNEEDNGSHISSGFQISVVNVDDSTKKIIIQCENPVNGTADVCIDYLVEKTRNNKSLINIQRMLKVENTGTIYAQGGSYFESNFLRSKSLEYIPIPVVNGYGEVTLTSNPASCTVLTLNQASCDCIYTVMSDYIVLQKVNEEEHFFAVANTEKNINALMNKNTVKYGDIEYIVDRSEIVEDEIRLFVNQDIVNTYNIENILFLKN